MPPSNSPDSALQRAAVAPLIPAERPVAVLRQFQWRSAAVVDLDHVTWDCEVVEPFCVVGVEVQASMRGIGVTLRPNRRAEAIELQSEEVYQRYMKYLTGFLGASLGL
jgi:hypothetical protein